MPRLIIAYVLNAIRLCKAEVATKEDIDKNHGIRQRTPISPFALMDVLGLDTTYRLANAFFQEYHDPQYAPPPLLTQLVEQGHWGQKNRSGFIPIGNNSNSPQDTPTTAGLQEILIKRLTAVCCSLMFFGPYQVPAPPCGCRRKETTGRKASNPIAKASVRETCFSNP